MAAVTIEKKTQPESLKYMIALAESEEKNPSASKVAERFGVNRSTVCRALSVYVKRGLLTESFQFTERGQYYIGTYLEKKISIRNALTEQGMSYEKAERNAMAVLCHCDSETADIIARSVDRLYGGRKKRLLEERKKTFPGSSVNDYLRVGNYKVSFLFSKIKRRDMEQVSMANGAFRHPGTLMITSKDSYLCLNLLSMEMESKFANRFLRGKLAAMQYEKDSVLQKVKINENCVYIPLEAFNFLYVREDNILQGKAELTMSSTVGLFNMPESRAILTIYC